MQMPLKAAGFHSERIAGPSFHTSNHTPRTLRGRLWVALACVVASCGLCFLPAAASAAVHHRVTHHRVNHHRSKSGHKKTKPWWTNLPGLGGGADIPLPFKVPVPPTPPTTPTPPSTPPPPGGSADSPGLTNGSYTNSAGTLAYELYVPSSYKPGTPVPLVVALHGCTQTADVFRQLTGWDKLAEQKGFIVVFPQQSSSNNQLECWNFFQSADMSRGSGEPSMIAGITQWVQQHYSVDPKRTYVNGLSAGGGMTSVMAATYPDLYAAAGLGSGCEYASTATCAGYQSADPVQAGHSAFTAMGSFARVMPVIVFEGDKDTTVPPINAQQAVQQWQTTDGLVMNSSVPSAPTGVSNATSPGGESYTVSTYGDGQGHELIQSWLVHGMSHAWSGGSSTEQYSDPSGPDETAAMYAFFANHPMP